MAPSATTPPSEQTSKGTIASSIDFFNNYSNWINGKPSSTSVKRHGINPATRDSLPEVPVSTKEDVDTAVKAARQAFRSWKNVPVIERQSTVIRFAEALEANKDSFSKLLTTEQGKPYAHSGVEITAACTLLKALANITLEEEIIEDTETSQIIVRDVPLGVAVGIVPWNFPVNLAAGKLASAVLTGNVMIVKPSPFTPYCGIKLVELAQQFFPPGVVQVLSGDDSLGPWLTEHPDVNKISFTGSTATGKRIMASAAGTLKRLTLELGGNDPAVVCEDVDIDATAANVANLAFLNSGQVCLLIKRIYVQDTIFEQFRDAIVKHTKTMILGNGLDKETTHGPVQNQMQYELVQSFFKDIESEKWKVATGGKIDATAKGYLIPPTIIDSPADGSRIVVEEPFGPIVPILSWHSEEEVIARANDTDMGLGASVWTRNAEKGRRLASQIEAGSVWVNNHFALHPLAAFGGHKQSGIGHEYGVGGLKAYTNAQSLFLTK